MPRLHVLILIALGLAFSSIGCQHPRALSVRLVPAHKDVLHVHVELPQPLHPLDYVSDSESRSNAIPQWRSTESPPLYEIHYSYYSGADLLAFVTFRRAPDGQMRHERTLVQPANTSSENAR